MDGEVSEHRDFDKDCTDRAPSVLPAGYEAVSRPRPGLEPVTTPVLTCVLDPVDSFEEWTKMLMVRILRAKLAN